MGTMSRQLSKFLYEGFNTNQKRIYGPGTLYEISYKIGTTKKDNERVSDVTQLLDKIHETPAEVMKKKTSAYTFAFECHAFNFPKKDDSDGIPEVLKGFSTYMFVPDTKKRFIKGNVESAFAEPNELEDEEDPLKLFSAVYSDDYGTSMNENLTVIELTLVDKDFYPIKKWKPGQLDPMRSLFTVFNNLPMGEFGGFSLVFEPTDQYWQREGQMRIRSIMDKSFDDDPSIFKRISLFLNNEAQPENIKSARGDIAAQNKEQLDTADRNEIKAIEEKLEDDDSFECTLRVYGSTPEIADLLAEHFSMSYTTTFGVDRRRHAQGFRPLMHNSKGSLRDIALRRTGKRPFVLSSDEIATLWHVPDSDIINSFRNIHKPLPSATKPPDELATITPQGPGDIMYMLKCLSSDITDGD